MLIFLVGFMGCGKSYIGRHLSEALQMDCIDMDKAIESKEDISIKELFETKGESYFRQLERDFIDALSPQEHLIISTGGGVPCFFDNMALMNAKGITIYLNRSKATILKRLLQGQHKRPLLQGLNKEGIATVYDLKMKERSPFYNQSLLHVADMDHIQIASLINTLRF